MNGTECENMAASLRWSDPANIISLAILLFIILLVISGNSLVIAAVFCSNKLRSVTNYLIVNLAVADLLVGLTVLPFSAIWEVFEIWIFGDVWCRMWLAVDVWMCTASILNLCAISLDRYVAVTRPVAYPSIMSTKRAKSLIAGVWVLSFVICFPPLVGWKDQKSIIQSVYTRENYTRFHTTTVVSVQRSVQLKQMQQLRFPHNRTHMSLDATPDILMSDTEGFNYQDPAQESLESGEYIERSKFFYEKSFCSPKCELTKDRGYVLYSALGSFYIPMFVMLFFYWRIYKAAVRTTRAIKQGFKTTKGIISDDNMEPLQKTFNYAITVANTDLGIPLKGYNEQIQFGDSIEGHAKLCKFMQTGIGAIFGPSSRQTSAHLLTVCDAKDVPYIYPHMSENVEGFNLYPNPIDLARILHDIINLFEWTHFTFLYESSEYLSILNGLMPFYGSDGPIINVLRYDLKLSGNFKAVLRRVRKSEEGHIVVVGSTPSVAELLKQAQQVGIMNDKYSYIIGNLDLQTFDLEEYKYSEANITGFRMFSPTQAIVQELISQLEMDYNENNNNQIANGSCPITLEMALTYDAVQVFAESTKNLVYRPQALNCSEQSNQVQADGSTFKNYMRSINMQEKTITGTIYFDGNIRKGYSLDIVELQTSGLVKIGTWDERNNLTIQRPPQSELWSEVDANSLVNKTFRVLISVPNKPYASLVESHKKLVGNNQYEGYSIDLIKELAAKLGFNYTFIDGGSDYGSFNKTTNKTTGMMKEINEGRADLAITDLTITSEREEIIDFSIPFMNLGIAILFTQPQKSPANNFSFMDPFSRQVWIYLGLVYIGVSFCFFILGRLSPTEWDNPYPCIEEPEELENQFTLNNSFWFTTGAFLQQGSEIAPKSLSTRTLASIWWFFTLIILSSYTANLAAFLTIEKPVGLINNVNELASDTRVKYGAKKTGSTRSFFSTSEHETYKKMNDFMVENPDLLFETNLEGVNRVKTDNNYAFLMESTSIEYHIVRECNLKKVGEPLDEKGYGIAMVKNWPYRDKFNNALLELQEQGVLARLKNKWWNEVGAGVCKKKSDSSEVNPLDLKSLGGVYLVLGVGSGLSLIYSLIMWCIYVARKSNYYEVPFGDAFLEELRIAIDVANKERILKSAQSVYSRSRNSLVSIDSIDTDSEIENSSKIDRESEKTI